MPPPHIATLIETTLAAARFTLRPPLTYRRDDAVERTIAWELFTGRLLDAGQTRERRTFTAWEVRFDDGSEPTLAILFDAIDDCLHVVRSLSVHGHEAYDDAGAIRTREAIKSQRELIASIRLDDADLGGELAWAVYQAVVGTSRLPLTSPEAPLPAFSFGQLFYDPGPRFADAVRAKRVEFALRSQPPDELEPSSELLGQLRPVFDAVSLTPYTDFAANVLTLVRRSVERGVWTPRQRIDFLAWLVKRLARHLNAYDLVTFHHRGANYPDALLVEAVGDELFAAAGECPDWFDTVARRRAVRSTYWLREFYRGLAVPDHPTSPGENLRVLPEAFPRLPDEQIFIPGARTRPLFENGTDLGKATAVYERAIADLAKPAERVELGTALYLDRPFGFGKRPGEPDATPLVATRTYSPTVARRWLTWAAKRFPGRIPPAWADELSDIGRPLVKRTMPARPGVVSLQDAFQTADDVRLVRTTRSGVAAVMARLELTESQRDVDRWALVVPDGEVVRVWDDRRAWLNLRIDIACGYTRRLGVEFPTVVRIWQAG